MIKLSFLRAAALVFFGLASLPVIAAPIRVACVGASITEGAGLKPGETYPAQLQKILGDKWEVRNFGASGRTLTKKGDNPYWNAPAFRAAQQFNPDVVIILMGSNDTKPKNWIHHDEFQADCQAFVETFEHLAAKPHVFLCLLPPAISPGNFGIDPARVREWTPIFKRVAADEHAGIIDMYSPLAGKPQLFQDRIHPTAAGALILAQTAAHTLRTP